MKKESESRRNFVKKSVMGGIGLSLTMSAKSYGNILGANDRVNFAVAGLNGRGGGLLHAINACKDASIGYICDVDSRVIQTASKRVNELSGTDPKAFADVRKLLEEKDLDAIVIATPDHWHAPMAIMAVSAGKHAYVEKPCSHNPYEGELLMEAMKKYGKLIQMGNQQRSAPTSIQAVKDIKDGIIGKVYHGKAWYSNKRGSIGKGKQVAAPEWLNWELWQGPAPREAYKDNYVHYNWHWFKTWGTGEVNNNGAHEIDVCRWALGVDYPMKVASNGGRYQFDDDWEFYDTQIASYEFEGDKMITWEGRSCNAFRHHGRGRGATIHGTEGTIMLDRNGYTAYDKDEKVIKEMKEGEISATLNTIGRGGLDVKHMYNFLSAIKDGAKLNSPIDEGHKSVLLCHLGNIAQATGGVLHTDPKNGRILKNKKAMSMWKRDYEKGWEPKV
ncbi:Gfo/Idh/MocA family oxidoreductase [Fulvivirgaceae bacterium BMA10]|uniref:Gfo/Idh/MocA family oxidoreductase n=1 Tax=Splendidivirga corallicola TaxID=3051826 RepID=A0ABT8KWA2_9BACT|nr:Gfo/Idh/MocA family oxidoreductase [Fulvivirgaceae bacterium BMA10]